MKDERGIAMVVAITLIGLLSSLGLYLVLESGTSSRISKSSVRSETAFNLADAGVRLGIYCITASPPSPGFNELLSTTIQKVSSSTLPKYMTDASLGSGSYSPSVDYVGHNTTPPPGWMINWQGYSNFYSVYYRARGQGAVPLPASQGNAASRATELVLRVLR